MVGMQQDLNLLAALDGVILDVEDMDFIGPPLHPAPT